MSSKEIDQLEVFRSSTLVGTLKRTEQGCELTYDHNFLENSQYSELSYRLKKQDTPLNFQGVNLPPFFAGLLPEGLRLKALVKKIKTSEDDLFSLLAAIGSQCIGDISVKTDENQKKSLPAVNFKSIDFYDFFHQTMNSQDDPPLQGEAIAGVQEKLSASMISFPLSVAKKNKSYILKLNPKDKPNLVENESLTLSLAQKCGINANKSKIITDKNNHSGLLVERFDRITDSQQNIIFLHQEDACQFLDRYPADKYRLSLKEISQEMERLTTSPKIEILKLLQVYAFSYLVGNGDLHAKNISLITSPTTGRIQLSPIYDLICTYIYKDRKMAIKINGRDDNITKKDFLKFAQSFSIPEKATELMITKLTQTFAKHHQQLLKIMNTKDQTLFSDMVKKRLADLS